MLLACISFLSATRYLCPFIELAPERTNCIMLHFRLSYEMRSCTQPLTMDGLAILYTVA